MGAAFKYFARASIDTFWIKEFLDKQKCDLRESSRTKFVQFVTSIRYSKSTSDNMSKAKKLVTHFIQANFDILLSEEFVDHWTERERSQTRSIRRATNTHAALDQANTHQEHPRSQEVQPSTQQLQIPSQALCCLQTTRHHQSLPTNLYYLNTTECNYETNRGAIKKRWIYRDNFDI